jgi:tetratricopeptide (TPR) repeat protein
MPLRPVFLSLLLLIGLALPHGPLRPVTALAAGPDDSGGSWLDENENQVAPPGAILRFPGMPPIVVGPDGRIRGRDGAAMRLGRPHESLKPSLSPEQRAKAAKAEALKRAMAPHKSHAELRKQMLDQLFIRLAKASDPGEASGIASIIERVWLHNDSATANLLMTRAVAALQAGHLALALELLDKIITLQPNWAAAWDKRAATRLLGGDLDGAVSDMRQVLKLEPRNFSTLAALGYALDREGFDKEALAVFRKSLALDPQQPEIKRLVDKLSIKVEGRDI